jgi:hypothetical protein
MTIAVESKAAMFGCLTRLSTLSWSGAKRIASVSAHVMAPRNGQAISRQSEMPATLATAKDKRPKRRLRGARGLVVIGSPRNGLQQWHPNARDEARNRPPPKTDKSLRRRRVRAALAGSNAKPHRDAGTHHRDKPREHSAEKHQRTL